MPRERRRRRLLWCRSLPPKLLPNRTSTQTAMRRGRRRIRPLPPSLIILQAALRERATRLLAMRRRPGQRIQRRPSQRCLSRQPINRLQRPLRLNPAQSLRQIQEMGVLPNKPKSCGRASPSRFRPTYAGANVGHPSRWREWLGCLDWFGCRRRLHGNVGITGAA